MFGLSSKPFSGRKKPARKPIFRPHFEALERRDLMSASAGLQTVAVTDLGVSVVGYVAPTPTAAGLALINGLPNTPVRSTALADYQRDGYVSRNDMLDILKQGTAGYTSATPSEVASLETLVSNGPTVAMPSYVQNLASKTMIGANDELQAEIKGMEEDGVSKIVLQQFLARDPVTLAQDISQQVDNWFLGQVHPDASYVAHGTTIVPTYQLVNVPLFNGTPKYQDVAQGSAGDCWLMASMAEVADRSPADIQNMFVDNGDGTYTVRFYNGSTPDYVTVDRYLPASGGLYDHPQGGDEWAALAEKAYAQENAAGWIGSSHQGVASYHALDVGYPQWAVSALTGLSTSSTTNMNADSVMDAWFQGSFVFLCTGDSPSSALVVPDHCYALVNYSAASFTLFNPWGTGGATSASNGKYYPGVINVACNVLGDNFDSWARAGAAVGTPAPQTITIAAFARTDAEPAVVAQSPTQLGVHQDSVFAARAEWSVDSAMLDLLGSVKHRGGASRLASSDAAVTDLSGDLDAHISQMTFGIRHGICAGTL